MNIFNIKKIIIIGCGGTGSLLIQPLCRYLFSINYGGELIFCDGDSYSQDNMSRQSFGLRGLGLNKAEYQANFISQILPYFENKIQFIDSFLSKNDVESLIEDNTVVINCSDNLAIRKYVEDYVRTITNAAHICCGNELHNGQIQLSLRINGDDVTPSIFQDHPEFNSDNDDRSEMTCQQLQELPGGGQVVCANMAAASIALNYVYQLFSDILPNFPNSGTAFNCLTNQFSNYNEREVCFA